ncbi:DUF2569 domain-containing protein [Methylobacterium sp. 1973]|uniref:DUF2569 domain-containing protein n=1 Tax=Methylobacterium sp. 1973 TaxID=3156421 RepID=UPI00339A5723
MNRSRIAVGFHRVGLILAVPVAAIGAGLLIAGAAGAGDRSTLAAVGGVALAAAGALYATCWSVGWAVRGFMGEPEVEPTPASLGAAANPVLAPVAVEGPRWVKRAPPTGFRGWLLLPAFGTIVAPFFPAKAAIDLVEVVTQAKDRSHPVFLFVYGEIALNCAMIALSAWALVLMVQRDRRYPKVYIAALAATAALVTADALLAQALFGVAIDQETGRSMGRAIGAALIWIPYMRKSKRVAGTFSK